MAADRRPAGRALPGLGQRRTGPARWCSPAPADRAARGSSVPWPRRRSGPRRGRERHWRLTPQLGIRELARAPRSARDVPRWDQHPCPVPEHLGERPHRARHHRARPRPSPPARPWEGPRCARAARARLRRRAPGPPRGRSPGSGPGAPGRLGLQSGAERAVAGDDARACRCRWTARSRTSGAFSGESLPTKATTCALSGRSSARRAARRSAAVGKRAEGMPLGMTWTGTRRRGRPDSLGQRLRGRRHARG